MRHVTCWTTAERRVTDVADLRRRAGAEGDGAPPPPPFWARMGAEVSNRPALLVAACLATVLGPAVVAHAGAATAPPPAAKPVQVVDTGVATPVPGDAAGWSRVAEVAARTCPGLPSAVLVSIGEVETGLGVLPGTSSAGARGPMQFLPSTWAAYGTDGNGDGVADVMDPIDAVHGAARLLCANGGADPDRLASALWNYNHSDDYVRLVLAVARLVPAAA